MSTLYLMEVHSLVKRDTEDCLLIHIPEQRLVDGEQKTALIKKRIPLIKVDEVVVLGDVTLTAAALDLLLERKIPVHFVREHGSFQGSLIPEASKNALLRIAQHQAHHDLQRRLLLASCFVRGKLSNQRRLLQRRFPNQSPAVLKDLAAIIESLHKLPAAVSASSLPRLSTGDHGISGTPLETVLGLEGQGSALYYAAFPQMLVEPDIWCFPGRTRRPPTDPVNALLSYGYTILANRVTGAVQLVGFDPYIGYLHSSGYGRPALALDLMEEFRPLIVDSVVVKLLNKHMVRRDDFEELFGTYRLKKEPKKRFLAALEERFQEEITHPVFGYRVSYMRCLELQARLLAKYLTGEIARYQPFLVR
ncbi:type I-D CRISPR-associated endonuclease Cas1d [Thermogemmatispora carboxidivorans]|uniref:type I-D CRISPR-associated endonuclease Cas1d n=1 Tax=Thermogemmatispora carboxidivorans TaxID=1382306 RepID=UPI00069AE2E7|nr:type I-D CRISPR-associated endonuclease Cas1d [Thermogemmatispora carboxidivorans]